MKAIYLTALLVIAALPAHAADCTIEQVTYTQPNAEGYTLTFRPSTNPNAWSNLEVTLKTPTREFKYSMTASNGYSSNYLVAVDGGEKEEASYHIHLYDKDFKTLDLPNNGVPAPEAILTPEIGQGLYYADINNNNASKEFLPADMWRRGKCE